jgi:hypothetical protein
MILGESERKYPWVDAFIFDHVWVLRGDGRGLASYGACEDQLEGLGVFD